MFAVAGFIALCKIATLTTKVEVLEAKLLITAEYAKQLGDTIDDLHTKISAPVYTQHNWLAAGGGHNYCTNWNLRIAK